MANDPNDTGPVWSSTEWEFGACAACAAEYDPDDPDSPSNPFVGLTADEVIQVTHCGGTGAICIIRATGQTCSAGTAPAIGDFPGPVQAFIWWGNGGYGLSTNGTDVYALGDAQTPVFTYPAGNGPPWDDLFAVTSNTIGVAADVRRNGQIIGHKGARATVNTAANTCCD